MGDIVAELMDGRPAINFPVAAKVIFGIPAKRLESKRPPDTDNLEKALWDALQRGDKRGKGRAIEDDKYVRGHVEKAERAVPKGEEFIWVRFYALNAGDYTLYDKACEAINDYN